MTALKGWRTRLFSFAVFALGLLQTLDPALLTKSLPANWAGPVLLGISVAVYLLRQVTTTPPGESS